MGATFGGLGELKTGLGRVVVVVVILSKLSLRTKWMDEIKSFLSDIWWIIVKMDTPCGKLRISGGLGPHWGAPYHRHEQP